MVLEREVDMSRLYDRLMRSKYTDSTFKEELKSSVVIDIENVAQYYYNDDTVSLWHINKDFPNLAPPFPSFFMEAKFPKTVNISGEISIVDTPSFYGTFWGAWFHPHPSYVGISPNFLISSKWLMEVVIFLEGDEGILPSWHWTVGVREDGTWESIIDKEKGLEYIKWMFGSFIVDRYFSGDIWSRIFTADFHPNHMEMVERANVIRSTFLNPALLAVSLMHCKNVSLEKRTIPEKINKKHAKAYGIPLTEYHTLSIEPMKRILKSEGNQDQVGLRQALHICRGHFKDYRHSKGLFGKHKGLYWWESFARGAEEKGKVIKDYKIEI